MRALRETARGLGLWARAGAALAVLALIGAVAALAGDPSAAGRQGDGERPVVADLPGRPLVDREGRPIRDAKGRPLRVAADGKTLLDPTGRPLRNDAGRPLTLGPRNRVPPSVRPPERRRRRADEPRAPRKQRRPAAPADRTPIRVAVAFLDLDNHNDFATRMGVQQRAALPSPQIRAVVSHINRTGGVLGRPVEAIEVEYDPASGKALTHVYKELCERIAASRALLAIDRHGYPGLTVPCLAKAGIPLVASWTTSVSSAFFERWAGWYISPGMLATDRIAEPYIGGLERAGFFGSDARVGLIHYRTPGGADAGSQALREALKQRGIRIAHEAEVAMMRSTGGDDTARIVAETQRAAIEFKRRDVTHVVSMDVGGGATGLVMRGALAQGYYPRFGLNSAHFPVWLTAQVREETTKDPRSSTLLSGIAGVGWSPFADVSPQDEPPPNVTRRTCDKIFTGSGVDVGDRSPHAQYAAYNYCDSFLFVRRALERSGQASVAGLRAGVEALGTHYQSALNLGTAFGPGRLFGAAEFRLLRYHADCACLRYGAPLD